MFEENGKILALAPSLPFFHTINSNVNFGTRGEKYREGLVHEVHQGGHCYTLQLHRNAESHPEGWPYKFLIQQNNPCYSSQKHHAWKLLNVVSTYNTMQYHP